MRRPVLQSEAAECGLACLAMVANHHGHKTSLAELRRKHVISLKGTTLNQLISIAGTMGFTARALRLELEELGQLRKPAVLHWGLNHFVVLTRVGRRFVTILDPARGQRRLPLDEVSKHFTGVALELTPAPDFEKKEKVERVGLFDLWSRAKGFLPSLTQLFLLAVVMQVFALATPLVTQLVVDEAITKGDLGFLNVILIGFAMLLLVQTGVSALRGYIGMYLGTQLTFQMRGNLLSHLMRLPAEYFEKRHVGDVTSRFGSMAPIQGFITGGVISAVLDGVMAIATLAFMFFYSWLLTAVTLAGLLIFLTGRLISFPYVRRLTEEGIHKGAEVQTIFLETIRGARPIKLFGRESERHSLWQNEYAEQLNLGVRLERFGIWSGVGNGLLNGAQTLLVYWLGAKMVIGGEMTLGMFFAFQAYRGQFSGRAVALVNQLIAFRMMGLHLERLADIVHTDPEPGIDGGGSLARPLEGRIEARNLRFRYGEAEPWVLDGVSFEIGKGETAALVGPSGGGKTTLLKLLVGLYEPTEGEILYDGVPLSAMGARQVRNRLGVVMQDDTLLSGSLSDNISFFDPEADQERVEDCAKKAAVHDDIMAMPMAYESLIGDMGSTLSGGQQQRVLLARALYRDPAIMFLDEGTANLDAQTEGRVLETLDGLDITQVIVAHRQAAIAVADRVFVVAEGGLKEATERAEGSPERE